MKLMKHVRATPLPKHIRQGAWGETHMPRCLQRYTNLHDEKGWPRRIRALYRLSRMRGSNRTPRRYFLTENKRFTAISAKI